MYVYLFVCLYVCLTRPTYVVPPPPLLPFFLKTFYVLVVNFVLYQIPLVSLTLCSTEYCQPSGQSSQVDLCT